MCPKHSLARKEKSVPCKKSSGENTREHLDAALGSKRK